MNKRIEELKARYTIESIDGPYATPYLDAEKFAKAIIQDCLFSVDEANMNPIYRSLSDEQRSAFDKAQDISIKNIREKFKDGTS